MRRTHRRISNKQDSISKRTQIIALIIIVIFATSALSYYLGLTVGVHKLSVLDPVKIYADSNRSVVTIQGVQVAPVDLNYGSGNTSQAVLGSGFVIQYGASDYIVTNYHVVDGMINATVTFWDGNTYPAKIVASDAYADLALISPQAPAGEFYPLQLVPSSSLKVGDAVAAIGNPYGYSASMTTGIVSQLGRSIQYNSGSGNSTFPIADVIQISAPINPGNSGGPLLNVEGNVVGVTAAVILGSQGLGFAVSTDTILRELPSLVSTGKYTKHSYMGIETVDMNYQLSSLTRNEVTYGVLVEKSIHNGPADLGGLKGGTYEVDVGGQPYILGGDVIVSINGAKILNNDALSTYLERNTVPGQTIQISIVRSGNPMNLEVTLGTRPPT